ncbi:MAG: Gfo/Idh/MocA family oxidoreductase, partial [Candidatus Sumerlaeota bacterium]|nr:Gfo/Idh/MocA family oxidoreductase [Candidatus Sumerlaeota bacterium]
EFVSILVDLDRDGEPVMANFSASMACPKPKNVFQAIGRKGFVVTAGGGEITVVRHNGFMDSKEMIEPQQEALKLEPDGNVALKRLYENFAKAIRGEEENQSTLRHGLRALAVGEAAVKSAECLSTPQHNKGGKVMRPFPAGLSP